MGGEAQACLNTWRKNQNSQYEMNTVKPRYEYAGYKHTTLGPEHMLMARFYCT